MGVKVEQKTILTNSNFAGRGKIDLSAALIPNYMLYSSTQSRIANIEYELKDKNGAVLLNYIKGKVTPPNIYSIYSVNDQKFLGKSDTYFKIEDMSNNIVLRIEIDLNRVLNLYCYSPEIIHDIYEDNGKLLIVAKFQ